MADHRPGVVIVGGSLAGLHTAEALLDEGYRGPVTIVDADEEPLFDRPPMSKSYLAGGSDEQALSLRSAEKLDALPIRWMLGQAATGLDVAAGVVVLADGTRLPYDDLVIATGVSPVLPVALDVPSAHTLRTRRDADRLRSHLRPDATLLVIGAGFIGLEVAATFRNVGAAVEVVEALPTPLHRQVGPVVGAAIRRLHETHGVRFHLGRQATQVEELGDQVVVTLDDGTRLEADALLVAVGSRPGVGWLEGSGLNIDNGILADEHLAAAPHVWAVGDVVRWPHPLVGRDVRVEHWTTAIEHAKHVAKQIAGTSDHAGFAALPYFWSDQYDKRIQAHGFPAEGAELELLDETSLEDDRFAALFLVDGRATAVVAMSHPKQVLIGRRRVLADLTPSMAQS